MSPIGDVCLQRLFLTNAATDVVLEPATSHPGATMLSSLFVTSMFSAARPFVLCAALIFGMSVTGCAPANIANTEIPDTDENREIYERVMTYKSAMEARDMDAIAAMVSTRYYSNSGTTETDEDDYGYTRVVEKHLPLLVQNVKAVQYQIIMRRIEISEYIDGKASKAFADYEFFGRFLYVEGGREGWRQQNDFNRISFVREEGQWMIVDGL